MAQNCRERKAMDMGYFRAVLNAGFYNQPLNQVEKLFIIQQELDGPSISHICPPRI